jgi:hypothetical protein
MRLAILASVLTAGVMWFALGGASVQSQTEAKPSQCTACGQAKGCPHCAAKGHGWHHAHQYEYKCVHQSERTSKKAADAMTAQFNGLGEDGWRLSKADGGFWCFKRIKNIQ